MEVPFPLLQAWPSSPRSISSSSLAHLQAAEFLYETRLFPEPVYTFKHALTHEVAYGSLLQERRRVLHARIVEALEALAPERVAEQVDRLAHHALRGEVWDKAVTYCQQAGARALDRAAFREAVASFEQALQALAHLPEHSDTRGLAIDLRLALGGPLSALGEHGRHLALLGEAEALARALDDRARLGRVLAGMAQVRRVTGDHDGAIAVGRQALALAADALGDSALQMRASYRLGQAYYAIGDFGRAAELLRRSVEAADRESGTPRTDMRIQSQAWLARTLGALGAFAEGRRHGEEALRLATLAGRGNTPIIAHACLGHLYLAQGDLEHAIRVLEPGLALCRASGKRDWFASDRGEPGLCLCAPGAPRGGACAAGGGDQRKSPHGRAARSCLPGRLAQRGLSSGGTRRGGLAARAPGARPGPAAQGTRERGARAAPAWRCPCPRRSPRCRTGRSALPAGSGPGRGTRYAPAPGALPPWSRPPVRQDRPREQARAALSAAIDLYRAMEMTFWLPQAEAALAQVRAGDNTPAE